MLFGSLLETRGYRSTVELRKGESTARYLVSLSIPVSNSATHHPFRAAERGDLTYSCRRLVMLVGKVAMTKRKGMEMSDEWGHCGCCCSGSSSLGIVQ